MFEEQGIQDELDAYNPPTPDGSNWKATMLIEYGDVNERKLGCAHTNYPQHCEISPETLASLVNDIRR